MDVNLYINGVLSTALTVLRIRMSFVEAWVCELGYSGRHDTPPVEHTDSIVVCRADTGARLFAGSVVEVNPGGIAREGIDVIARGRRDALENEPVNINGRGFYIWNRRGHRCNYASGEDSPGRDGGRWTPGEIAIDILEHALGLPAAGSDIAGHHSNTGCVTDTYLAAADIAAYDAADWLALDSPIGEFSVDNTPVADALDELLGMNGGFYGWYIDPYGTLRLVDLPSLPETDIAAGELGHWQDEAGKDYELLDNRLEWSLEGCYSRVMVQGADRTVEVKPENLDGCGNAALNGGGELELVNQPWKDYDCAYRSLEQPYRHWCGKGVGWGTGSCPGHYDLPCECGVPDGVFGIPWVPRIYRGTDAGDKEYVGGDPALLGAGRTWRVNFRTGIIMFYWDIAADLDPGEKLWGWYWARLPFTVEVGPEGNAYSRYGRDRTLKIYDPSFKHSTSWPDSGDEDDETAMETLAERMLQQRRDVRVQGTVVCDEVDPDNLTLRSRYNITNLEGS